MQASSLVIRPTKDEAFSDLAKYFAEASDIAYPSAVRAIPPQAVIGIDSVNPFEKGEYAAYGKYTTLDHYAFVWKDGPYGLVLDPDFG